MSDDQSKELAPAHRSSGEPSDIYSSRQSSAELLDLVRSAEEAATVATDEPAPESFENIDDDETEEVVDVGEEAIDAPPSLPPCRAATPEGAVRPRKHLSMPRMESAPPSAPVDGADGATDVVRAAVLPSTSPAESKPVEGRPVPPLIGIVVPIALAIIALIAVTR